MKSNVGYYGELLVDGVGGPYHLLWSLSSGLTRVLAETLSWVLSIYKQGHIFKRPRYTSRNQPAFLHKALSASQNAQKFVLDLQQHVRISAGGVD